MQLKIFLYRLQIRCSLSIWVYNMGYKYTLLWGLGSLWEIIDCYACKEIVSILLCSNNRGGTNGFGTYKYFVAVTVTLATFKRTTLYLHLEFAFIRVYHCLALFSSRLLGFVTCRHLDVYWYLIYSMNTIAVYMRTMPALAGGSLPVLGSGKIEQVLTQNLKC